MTRLRSSVVAAGLLAGLLIAAGGPSYAAAPVCERAVRFADRERLTSAVAAFAAAARQDRPCGTARAARVARTRLAQADRLVQRGISLQRAGSARAALDALTRARALNREAPVADRLQRLRAGLADARARAAAAREATASDRAAPTAATTPAAEPTAGASAPPTGDAAAGDGADRSAWWWVLALVALGAAPLGWWALRGSRRGTASARSRRGTDGDATVTTVAASPAASAPPPSAAPVGPRRVVLQVEQSSGAVPDLAGAFAVLVRARLTGRGPQETRLVHGADAPVDIEVAVARGVAAAADRYAVTLHVTLLPAQEAGPACHVMLVGPDGTPARGHRLPERVIAVNRATEDPQDAHQWLPLADLVADWTRFAVRSLQVGASIVAREFGTARGSSYLHLVDGVHAQPDRETAVRHLREALALDPDYVEARVDLAALLADGSRREVLEARRLLEELRTILPVPAGEAAPAMEHPGDVRLRGLWYRTVFLLLTVRLHLLTMRVDDRSLPPEEATDALDGLQELATALWHRLGPLATTGPADRDDESDRLLGLRRALEPQVAVLRAAILDLEGKLRAGLGDAETDADSRLPGLPLSLDPLAAPTPEQGEAVRTLRAVPLRGTPAPVQYAVAAVWARDARLRGPGRRGALRLCAERLALATTDSALRDRWVQDPAFRAVADDLLKLGVPAGPTAAPADVAAATGAAPTVIRPRQEADPAAG